MSKIVTYLVVVSYTMPSKTPMEYRFVDNKLDRRTNWYKRHKDHIVKDEDMDAVMDLFEDNGAMFKEEHYIRTIAIMQNGKSAGKVRDGLKRLGYEY